MPDDEQIPDGGGSEEVDVEGQQEPVDWGKQPSSDALLSREAAAELGLTG